MTTTIDPATAHLLAYQGRRMRSALSQIPPDRKEALAIQVRVDDLLDRRPALAGYASDGEPIWANSSPNVMNQIDQPFVPIVPSTDLAAEPAAAGPPADGGGVGVLDRPRDPAEPLSREAEDEIRRFGRRLGDIS